MKSWWQLSPSERRKARLEWQMDAKWRRRTARIQRDMERYGMDIKEYDRRLLDLCAQIKRMEDDLDEQLRRAW